jgi:putative ABC transport system ATP-binding protein
MARPTSGRISVNGQETTSLPEKFLAEIRRNTFGFVFQNYNLIKGITVLENTMLPAYPTGQKHREVKAKAMELLKKLKIDSKVDQKIELLSGGEQQRTAIARALMNEPSLIIADEPTAHLDTELSKEFLNIVAELQDEGKTILIASHDPLVFGAGIVDDVVEMRDGQII